MTVTSDAGCLTGHAAELWHNVVNAFSLFVPSGSAAYSQKQMRPKQETPSTRYLVTTPVWMQHDVTFWPTNLLLILTSMFSIVTCVCSGEAFPWFVFAVLFARWKEYTVNIGSSRRKYVDIDTVAPLGWFWRIVACTDARVESFGSSTVT